ncbi:formylglycine-generating enzyme family protein [Magnetococcus sp. PR-3]|uniref:formylglycine-generating enzyme family protein n=1 Tax=Magnetococcus sp. PR-3 TaxID=3120355 RepID=UPI002FCE102E
MIGFSLRPRWFIWRAIAMGLALFPGMASAFLVNQWEPIDTSRQRAQPAEVVQPGQHWLEPLTGIEMVWIEGRCFKYGSAPRIDGRDADEGPVRDICLSGYWIARTEMTQGQWRHVMRNNPSQNRKGDEYPVEQIAWDDVEMYLGRLNSFYKGKVKFRLPTEAEWEFACRNRGQRVRYATGSSAGQGAWYRDNSGNRPQKVATRRSNRIGLFDMSGNVWEWTQDAYDGQAYAKAKSQDPLHEGEQPYRVIRGGSFSSKTKQLRCSNRGFEHFSTQSPMIGLRLAAEIDIPVKKKPINLRDALL